MNCDQVKTEIVAYLKGEFTGDRKTRFEEHLARCPACRRKLEDAKRVLAWAEAASDEAVVKKINDIIDSAVREGATDIHFEPRQDNSLAVRTRIDGVMQDIEVIDSVQRYGTIARLKTMGEMTIPETDTPQEGRFPWTVEDTGYDIRAVCVPTIWGERVVLRILPKGLYATGLKFIENHFYEDLETIKRLISQPTGLLVISGPMGSGKTTTAYCLTAELATSQRIVFSLEDPVECILPGVNQVQVDSRSGMGMADALRAVGIQDPDVIFVAEIPDGETAQRVAENATAGHFVLVSLSTDSAVSAIEQLREMGIGDYMLGMALIGITNQRLVRRVCESCKEEIETDADDPAMIALGISADDLKTHKLYRGKGCKECRQTGYRGRTMLMEVLEGDDETRKLIARGASADEIMDHARKSGFLSLKDKARLRVLDGVTTPEEALRVGGGNG